MNSFCTLSLSLSLSHTHTHTYIHTHSLFDSTILLQPGWPDKHLSSIGWKLDDNQCVSCPDTGNSCPTNHRMSPINLVRDRAIEDHPNWKDCPDWHWMNFEDGTCAWDDMEDSFEISRHALQIHTPMRSNGDINCANSEGERLYPRLDYSKGFPDWWHLDRTDVKVPSEHTQHGKRYAAEISLAHFYELDHYKNQIGYVTLFMQDYPNEKPWHYLDKLICKWRREEEKQREKCGLPPAPVYKMCELYRGQERTRDDMEFFEEENTPESPISKESQLVRPSPIPIDDFGGNPDAKKFPLQLCQGDCDFTEDCAIGLICHRREANEAAPGCIGGEDSDSSSDFCVFDAFGPGYNPVTDAPTLSPTKTNSPTITPLPPQPVVDFGGSPPLTAFPLQRCQGDCDLDDECAEGLICFQRGASEAVPGCIGGEANTMMTDYCILDPRGDGYTDLDTPSPTGKTSPAPSKAPVTVPTGAPTKPPVAPTSVPTKTPVNNDPRPVGTPKEVSNRGWEPNFLLDECEGDCDDSSDCMSGLICFSREASSVPVPGCSGGDEDTSLTDYCIYPPLDTNDEIDVVKGRLDTASPSIAAVPSPIDAPSKSPSRSPRDRETSPPTKSTPKFDDEPVRLNPLSWSPPRAQLPLDLCQGDCDVDDDCGPGLVCFQRFKSNTQVPGCIGGDNDSTLMDYCIIDQRSIPLPPPLVVPATTIPPVAAPIAAPVSAPVPATFVPVPASQLVSRTDIPPPIECSSYSDLVNFQRFCDNDHQDMCCKSPRSDSNYCHENYGIFGDDIYSACHHCCQQERGEAHEVGPPNEAKPGLEPYTECAALDNSARLCKAESCCDPDYADTQYCREQMAQHPGDFERICWSCCHPSKVFPLDNRLLLEVSDSDVDGPVSTTATAMTKEEMRLWHKNNPRGVGPKDVVFNHTSMHRELIVREENFVEKGLKDEDAYFKEIHGAYQRRELQTPVKENYDDVFWWPYEWLLKVGTEYYYRYEGSMTVPPCYTVNHWRVMKDPIRVAKHQITELERLLAWRMNGNCKSDTAGKAREDNPDAVDVARPIQEMEKGHRMVFCECQDWPSKFPQEREWCEKWQQREPELRLFENPYNWNQLGF
jgi:hypothetical protein